MWKHDQSLVTRGDREHLVGRLLAQEMLESYSCSVWVLAGGWEADITCYLLALLLFIPLFNSHPPTHCAHWGYRAQNAQSKMEPRHYLSTLVAGRDDWVTKCSGSQTFWGHDPSNGPGISSSDQTTWLSVTFNGRKTQKETINKLTVIDYLSRKSQMYAN